MDNVKLIRNHCLLEKDLRNDRQRRKSLIESCKDFLRYHRHCMDLSSKGSGQPMRIAWIVSLSSVSHQSENVEIRARRNITDKETWPFSQPRACYYHWSYVVTVLEYVWKDKEIDQQWSHASTYQWYVIFKIPLIVTCVLFWMSFTTSLSHSARIAPATTVSISWLTQHCI